MQLPVNACFFVTARQTNAVLPLHSPFSLPKGKGLGEVITSLVVLERCRSCRHGGYRARRYGVPLYIVPCRFVHR